MEFDCLNYCIQSLPVFHGSVVRWERAEMFFFEADQLTKGVVQRAGQYFSNALLTEGRQGGAFGTQVIV